MEKHIVRIISKEPETHDTIHWVIEKPAGFQFIPGQAVDVSINQPGWEHNLHPFTFNSLNEWENLEFITKIYPKRNGVTYELSKLKPGDELIFHEVFGTINYKGPGYFIAGGAGITPMLAIFRQLEHDNALEGNALYFSNKNVDDIIRRQEFEKMLGENFVCVLTDKPSPGFETRRIDEDFLREKVLNFTKYFYICGPDQMVSDVKRYLKIIGIREDRMVYEK